MFHDVPPLTLSTEELFQGVRALHPSIAVFDCDGTLWSGDAGSSFMYWTLESGLPDSSQVAWLKNRYESYLQGQVSEVTICGEMVQVYSGLPEIALRQAAAEFYKTQIAGNVFPELHRLVRELLGVGVQVWAVSSTNQWVIEEAVRHFGIEADRVLAARVLVREGLITNEILDVPTDQGKVSALQRVGVRHPDAVFGNSVHDAAMLAIARQAFPINPTNALIERSTAENWAIYHPDPVLRAPEARSSD